MASEQPVTFNLLMGIFWIKILITAVFVCHPLYRGISHWGGGVVWDFSNNHVEHLVISLLLLVMNWKEIKVGLEGKKLFCHPHDMYSHVWCWIKPVNYKKTIKKATTISRFFCSRFAHISSVEYISLHGTFDNVNFRNLKAMFSLKFKFNTMYAQK